MLQDASTYASWAENTTGNYALSGVFFDETPNNITVGEIIYTERINEFVKSQKGFRAVNYVFPLFQFPFDSRSYITQVLFPMILDYFLVRI